jgi:hypothetical protein
MSDSTGVVLAVGGITAANELVFAPLANGGSPWKNFNWRIIPATAIFALAMAGVDQVSPQLGRGIAVIALVTVLVTPFGNAPAPVENVAKVLGYSQGGKKP